MTNEEAKTFLTHYICSCQYGTSPTNCNDDKCKFGIAVRTLCDEEQPTGEWIRKSDPLCYWFECSRCNNRPLYWHDVPMYSEFCPFCGAKMKGGETDE